MKKVYMIDEEKGFNKIFDKENVSKEQRKELMDSFNNLLKINVVLENRNNSTYQFIFDNEGNKKRMDDFNSYEKSLINLCFSDFMGIKTLNNEHIEIQ